MKKAISLLLALLMLVPGLMSCSEGTVEEDGNNPAAVQQDPVETEAETEERIKPNLPDVTYDGAEFRFYSWNIDDWRIWDDIWVESLTGEPINDAVFERNQMIEDTYKVKIGFTYDEYQTYENTVRTGVAAGDNAWEVIISMGHCIPRLYPHNVFYNLHDLDHVDFDQPWWDQNCVDSFTLAGYMPFTVSDMIILDKAVCSATFFNKQLAENHQLGNLYEIVKEGKWTIDKMIELGEVVANDVNNDGIATDDDIYGLLSGDDPVYMLFHSAGGRYITKDENGYPQLSFESEYNFTVIKYYLEELMYKEHLTRDNDFVDGAKKVDLMFMEDQGLFFMSKLSATNTLREMESDFGIIPVPNYDENQDHYSSSVSVFGGNLISVPVTNQALDMTGLLLEAMSAESMYGLIPAFYETVLKEKSARDPDSVEMIDIIINNMVFDVGDYYNLADFPDYFLRITGSAAHLGRDQRTSDIVSFWKKKQKGTEVALKKLIKVIDGWNEMKGAE